MVETKNMKGWIFGSANQKQWTQKIFKHTAKFQNPLHQNYKHVKALESCLGINNDAIFSVIIFIGDSRFKTDMPENVTFARGGIEYIKSKTEAVLSADGVANIINKIETGQLTPNFKTNRAHVKHVKNTLQVKQERLQQVTDTQRCTKCGADMVKRTATKGKNAGNEFLGCSALPKCRSVLRL